MRHLGELLVNLHIVSQKDLDGCLEVQRDREPAKPIGQILIEAGLLDTTTLRETLTIHGHLAASYRPNETSAVKSSTTSKPAAHGDRDSRATLSALIQATRDFGGSALHVSAGEVPRIRLHGNLLPFDVPAISPQDCRAQILALLPPALHDGFTKSGTIEFCANLGPLGRIRASLLEHQKGIAARFSPVPDPVPTPADLHLPEAAARFTELRSGLVIVTGPRGSGRTTAIASLVNDINRTSQKHIVVLDETLEHSITSHTSFVSQRKIGEHAVSSSAAMRATLRQDADVIVAGNLGTPDATNAALTAAEMGHLVFGECSSHNAADTLSRLVEQYPDDRRTAVFRALSMNLRAILCLDLAPNADGKGRSLAYEVLVVDEAIAELIRDGRVWQIPMLMQADKSGAMVLLDDCLERLVETGTITSEQALLRATERLRFANLTT